MNVVTPGARSIFLAAIELRDRAEWPAYLARVCVGDSELRRRVEELLEAHEETAGAVDRFAPWAGPTAEHPGPVEGPGTVIGVYTLLEPIGEGGMGVVYMAEQDRPVRRRIALKVIKPGMDTRQVVARFEAERQALALMDHPNIAKVHDAGSTESGRPYFVMELVKGIPITDYCDRARLPIPERLELFVLVCRAVQHAHQKGIIHRDLKPSNILVTVIDGAAVPKVLDFGVAKATGQTLTDRTLFTGHAQLVGTPLYMSPEQAELSGVDVDTRSDVYSLGVLLYEILTGTTPFDAETLRHAAFDEMRRIIREVEPPKPSTRLSTLGEALTTGSAKRKAATRRLGQSMRGELDWIVMKSLEKDRTRRYETANDLAADVMRYQTDQPVEACAPSARYRFAKFARRHRAALTTAALFAVALIAGTAMSVWQAVRAVRAEHGTALALAEARLQRQQARRAVDEMYTQVAEKWLARQPKRTSLQGEFLVKALAFYEQFAAERGDEPEARFDAARARRRVAHIQQAMGQFDRAETSYRHAVEQLEGLAARFPDRDEYRQELGLTLGLLSALHGGRGRIDAAESLAGRAIAIHDELVLHHPENREYRSGLAKGLLLLGGNFMSRSLMDKAEAVAQRGRDLLQGLHAQAPEDETTRESLARCEWNLGRVFEETTRRPEAEQAYRRAADHLDALLADDPTDPDHRSLLAAILNDLASVRRGDEAIATYRRAEALIESLVNEFPDRPEHRGRLLKCLTGLTQTHGRYEEIEDASRRGVELAERFVKDDPGSHSYRSALSSFLSMLGQSIRYKQPEQAREHLKRAYDLGQELVTDFPDVANHRYNLALVCTQIAGNSVVGPPDDPHYSPALGLERARQAVELLAEERFPRAPLGWALYRSGDWRGCIEALEGVLKDYDDHFLAMAYWRLGDKARSRHEFERADASLPELVKSWVPGEFPDPTFRRRIRAEAAALLGLDAATRGEDGVTPPEGGAGSK